MVRLALEPAGARIDTVVAADAVCGIREVFRAEGEELGLWLNQFDFNVFLSNSSKDKASAACTPRSKRLANRTVTRSACTCWPA